MIDDPWGAFTCPSSTLTLSANSDTFRGLLLTVLGAKRFPRLLNPGVRLRVGHQHSQFWPILGPFMDYYPLFWGPKVISMVDGPQGVLTCNTRSLG